MTNTLNTNPKFFRKRLSARELTLIALLGVLSYLLMLIRFPLPFMPPFMDFDFAAVPELLGTFLLGPVPGLFIIAIKLLLKTATTGSSSAFTGELINFVLNASFVLIAWFIYRLKKTRRMALVSMIVATVCTAVIACIANVYFIIPLYARLFGFDMDAVIGMTQAVNPNINSVSTLVIIGILPFNIIKNGIATAIVFLVYKRIVKVLRRFGGAA
jgi:riboflavin transporter FmnP